MKQLESKLQQQCVRWFRHQYPDYVLFAIPNGGHRDIRVAARMKAEGQLAGVPDLLLCHARVGFHGLFIEMKIGKNKPTETQLLLHAKLRTEGYGVAVVYSFDEFVKLVENYLFDDPM